MDGQMQDWSPSPFLGLSSLKLWEQVICPKDALSKSEGERGFQTMLGLNKVTMKNMLWQEQRANSEGDVQGF